jgi:hypothetical protein
MYHLLFEKEDAMHFFRLNQKNLGKAISTSNLVNYIRESFVLFLKLIKDRLAIPEERWLEAMDRFFDLDNADKSLPMDTLHYQDLCAHLYRQSVYTAPFYHQNPPKIGRFSNWETVPPLVRIILLIPREKLDVLDK